MSVGGIARIQRQTSGSVREGESLDFGDSGTDRAFKESALEVVRYSSWLDPADGATIDISPGAIGNNALGSYEARGHAVNPVTGVPYPQNTVLRADFGRVMAEFWADGPDSETPPGHWNTLANTVADSVEAELRIGGTGRAVDRLEWDVKMYFALNGAMHGSAIAAWGSKVAYDYSRPISMIRYMGGLGQSSDESDGPSFHPGGLPLEPGLVEVITRDSTAPGQRHRHLASHVGEIAIQAWTPGALDADSLPGEERVAWHLATTWVPYQKETFVTPAFAAYVSGHSTFSQAGAEVLAALTGSEFFPGGLGFWTIPAGSLDFDDGPTTDITLQWTTYGDAADQAGVSRLFGGIHVRADDIAGRFMGALCGRGAWNLATTYFDGTATG